MVAVVVFVALFLALLLALVLISYLLAPRKPSDVKHRRFEAGGPPYGTVQRRLVMQYIGYIYLVTVVEAALGLAIVAVLTNNYPLPLALSIALLMAAVAAVVARYYKTLADARRWGGGAR
ncbi:NADH-quinone oxidoreductase subunit A [Pyrobaculum neutrophilum]|uniref:NADH-ubiquinone oxidoreductase subunit n=1 Tax=Pyrobaculum neutrophilum (strain DSM 2338 / JCM 9278 / NBRC 100436 / V24Sta) TaxID=444157 RepID=B1YB10_PYRNV|nr:NADH-quinone oxidoreductase subunit A [Pyrobaculum neutrophilum]ACB40710.1 NADH-ubiquinone oxidoreductase subunit [Pyrobaculum neutrophilum V24Sta]